MTSRNFSDGVNGRPMLGDMNSTSTDQMLQMEKPMCSDRIEKIRLRRATCLPLDSQNSSFSGSQPSIQRPLPAKALVVNSAPLVG